jgi:hypothetical protein
MTNAANIPCADLSVLQAALAAPFQPSEVEWKPQTITGSRALAVCYVDARAVMARLDRVVGLAGWQDDYEVLTDGNVICRLRLRLGGEWITKADVGGESDQKDEGDRRKASFSDALKRAAVKWGVGRYLYSLAGVWCDYDPQKKRFVSPPALPASALPARAAPAKPAANGHGTGKLPPANGQDLADRLAAWEKTLVGAGLCAPDDLIAHVKNAGSVLGRKGEISSWDAPAAAAGWQAAAEFDLTRRRRALNDARLAARREWSEVMAALKLDRGTKSDALTRRQMDEALRMLREEAPAPDRGGG